jgi:hypothetical protein
MDLTRIGRWVVALGGVLAACALLLPACGGGADTGTETDTTVSTSSGESTTELTRPSTTSTTIEPSI